MFGIDWRLLTKTLTFRGPQLWSREAVNVATFMVKNSKIKSLKKIFALFVSEIYSDPNTEESLWDVFAQFSVAM